MSAITNVPVTGTTTNASSTETMMIAGARTNSVGSAKGGVQSSLVNILTMSARGCRRPAGPTRLGPRRSWKKLSRRRSNQVRPAAIDRAPTRTTSTITRS